MTDPALCTHKYENIFFTIDIYCVWKICNNLPVYRVRTNSLLFDNRLWCYCGLVKWSHTNRLNAAFSVFFFDNGVHVNIINSHRARCVYVSGGVNKYRVTLISTYHSFFFFLSCHAYFILFIYFLLHPELKADFNRKIGQ
jgi:hypothetical protein